MARSRKSNFAAAIQELNLVPYLDIMVNLVLFMLVTITSFLSFTILNASIPQIATDAAQAEQKLSKEELMLVVRVMESGYRVDPSVQGGKAIDRQTYSKREGKHDYENLKKFMVSLKDRFKEEQKVLIVAEPSIPYDTIIQTMDAVRETEPGVEDLFPEVTLSIL